MFIIMACWNRTDRTETTSKRLAHTLSHAAVAITITSLTDVLSFAVGCITTIVAVQGFCAFAAAAVVFNYIYMVNIVVLTS